MTDLSSLAVAHFPTIRKRWSALLRPAAGSGNGDALSQTEAVVIILALGRRDGQNLILFRQRTLKRLRCGSPRKIVIQTEDDPSNAGIVLQVLGQRKRNGAVRVVLLRAVDSG